MLSRQPGSVQCRCLQAGGEWTDEKTSQIRRITAKRLLESKTTIPHYYLTVDCKVWDQCQVARCCKLCQ